MTEVILGQVPITQVIVATKYKGLDIAPTTPQLANAEVELNKLNKKFIQTVVHS